QVDAGFQDFFQPPLGFDDLAPRRLPGDLPQIDVVDGMRADLETVAGQCPHLIPVHPLRANAPLGVPGRIHPGIEEAGADEGACRQAAFLEDRRRQGGAIAVTVVESDDQMPADVLAPLDLVHQLGQRDDLEVTLAELAEAPEVPQAAAQAVLAPAIVDPMKQGDDGAAPVKETISPAIEKHPPYDGFQIKAHILPFPGLSLLGAPSPVARARPRQPRPRQASLSASSGCVPENGALLLLRENPALFS